jgi:hypothetical protein
MYFPTLCSDNFFENPDKIRDFALSLEFQKSDNKAWPGKRTKALNLISENYFNLFCRKFLALSFDLKRYQDFSWNIETYFQMIEPGEYCDVDQGWVHVDDSMYAGVIYLTPEMDLDCGTSIFRPKSIVKSTSNLEEKHEMFLNFNPDKTDVYNQKLKENNSQFEETMRINNVYNRLLAYDGAQFHGVTNFSNGSNKTRLTQVFFVREINSPYFPIPSSKQVQL